MKKDRALDATGSSFDSLLEAEGIREEVEAIAIKRVLAWQLEQGHAPAAQDQAGHGERTPDQPLAVGPIAGSTKRLRFHWNHYSCGGGIGKESDSRDRRCQGRAKPEGSGEGR